MREIEEEGQTSTGADCVERLRVLAEPTRLQVLRLLLDGPLQAGEIQRRLDVEQTLLSHHLRVLRENHLVAGERSGKAVLYRLLPEVRVPKAGSALDLGCCVLAFEDEEERA